MFNINDDDLYLIVGESFGIRDNGRMIGNISREDTPVSSVSFTYPLIHVIPKNGRIYGVTVLGNEMFLKRSTGSSVVVEAYSVDNFSLNKQRSIVLPDIKSMGDMSSCGRNNCLYISDTSEYRVHRYDCTSNAWTKWTVDGRCDGLSVTRTYNVLVTLPRDKRIEEYTTSGDLMRVIYIDDQIDNPRHCIQLSTGQFVVTNGYKNEEKAGVHVVSESGIIVHSIGGTWQNPVHITVAKDDQILMVDECFQINNKVKVLTPALTYLEDIVIPDYELKGPSSLYLDQLNNRLYIGEDSGGRLFVLNVDI